MRGSSARRASPAAAAGGGRGAGGVEGGAAAAAAASPQNSASPRNARKPHQIKQATATITAAGTDRKRNSSNNNNNNSSSASNQQQGGGGGGEKRKMVLGRDRRPSPVATGAAAPPSHWRDDEYYDLAPVRNGDEGNNNGNRPLPRQNQNQSQQHPRCYPSDEHVLREQAGGSPDSYYSIDPWEMSTEGDIVEELERVEAEQRRAEVPSPPRPPSADSPLSSPGRGDPPSPVVDPAAAAHSSSVSSPTKRGKVAQGGDSRQQRQAQESQLKRSSRRQVEPSALGAESSSTTTTTFLGPGDIHPNMEQCNQQDIERLRLLAGKLSVDWRRGGGGRGGGAGGGDSGDGSDGGMAAPALARRIRDFQFAQEKRRKKYGDERPWGILGLYDFLSSIRIDVEWAEDASRRRANGESYLSWADFDESKRSGRNRPFFTYILLFVCTVMLIASIAVNGWKVEPVDENPMIGPSAQTLLLLGAKDTYLIVVVSEGWRLLSSTVLHAGLVHFFINMLALWFVGGAIETSHGWVAAMIIFCISAVGGTILSALFLPEYITVGASGGIFGFIGACLADIIMNWKLLFCDFVTENGKKQSHIMVVAILVFDIVLNSIIGLTPFVDNFTHLGGMVYGFLCGISTMERLSTDFFGMEEAWTTRAKHFFMRFFGIILSIVSIVVTLVVLLAGDGETTPCPNCTWLSCVQFPPWEDYDHKWWYCDGCGRVSADIVTQPFLHLELECPDHGDVVTVDLTNETDVSRPVLVKKLPAYCREFCLATVDEQLPN